MFTLSDVTVILFMFKGQAEQTPQLLLRKAQVCFSLNTAVLFERLCDQRRRSNIYLGKAGRQR